MTARTVLFASTLAASILTAFATVSAHGEDAPAPTRDQVRADFLQARATGHAMPAGEASALFADESASVALTRADVCSEFALARMAGQLVPRGDASSAIDDGSISLLSRAQVRDEVRVAQARGELMPAGEAYATPIRQARRATSDAMIVATRSTH